MELDKEGDTKNTGKGRPAIPITKAKCESAKVLAAQGLTLRQIAANLGMAYQTLNEKSKEYSDFSDAIAEGKAIGIKAVTNALYDKAVDGDVPAMKYFLNNRDNDNWKDRIDNTHSGPGGEPIKIDSVFEFIPVDNQT